MPKSTHRGPSYAGHVDVSSPDTAAPEWAESTLGTEPVSRETAPELDETTEAEFDAAHAEGEPAEIVEKPKPSPRRSGGRK